MDNIWCACPSIYNGYSISRHLCAWTELYNNSDKYSYYNHDNKHNIILNDNISSNNQIYDNNITSYKFSSNYMDKYYIYKKYI